MCDYTCGKEPFDLQLVESADTEPTDMEGQSAIFFFFLAACTTCGILVPRPGIEPAPPALEGEVLTTGPPGKSRVMLLRQILLFLINRKGN